MVLEPREFYAAANLKNNPFRSNPVFGSDPRMNIWVGYEREKQNFMKFLVRSRADQVGNISFVMLYGPYGAGKSHALLWARHQIESVRKDEFNAVCYYIPTLKKDKGRLTFAGAFRDDLIEKTSLTHHVLQYRGWLNTTILRYRDQEQLDHTTLDAAIVEKIIPAVDLYNFAKEILKCETEVEVEALIAPSGLTDYQAMVMFTRLVNLFVFGVDLKDGTQRFKRATYLMLDELDDLLSSSAKEAREVNDILRHIYDSCPNCFGLVVALSAEVSILPSVFADYIMQRIQRQIILGELDKDDGIEFVKRIMTRIGWRVTKRPAFIHSKRTPLKQ